MAWKRYSQCWQSNAATVQDLCHPSSASAPDRLHCFALQLFRQKAIGSMLSTPENVYAGGGRSGRDAALATHCCSHPPLLSRKPATPCIITTSAAAHIGSIPYSPPGHQRPHPAAHHGWLHQAHARNDHLHDQAGAQRDKPHQAACPPAPPGCQASSSTATGFASRPSTRPSRHV